MSKPTIRTITLFVTLPPNACEQPPVVDKLLADAWDSVSKIKQTYEESEYVVQTVRLCVNNFVEFVDLDRPLLPQIQVVETTALAAGFDFLSFGTFALDAADPRSVKILNDIPDLLKGSKIANFSASMGSVMDAALMAQVGGVVKQIAMDDVFSNFRFCVTCHVRPGTPFFPASFHARADGLNQTFAIGLETSDLLETVLLDESVTSFALAEQKLSDLYLRSLKPIQDIATRLSKSRTRTTMQRLRRESKGIQFTGIDASLNPSLSPIDKGIGGAYAKFMSRIVGAPRRIGNTGSLATSFMITKSIQSLSYHGIMLTGYSGLMLPLLEDIGLAEAANASTLSVTDLLQYSAVCGVGVDTVAIPGDATAEAIGTLFLDVQALSLRWDKPLSCRVFPIPGKSAGELTEFNSPYLCNAKILSI